MSSSEENTKNNCALKDKMQNHYIDFGVTPYALADVCEALFNNGVTNGFLTKEDGDIHVRWGYNVTRKRPIKNENKNNDIKIKED